MSSDAQSERTTRVFRGSLDYVSDRSIEGWAFDPSFPTHKVEVTITLNNREVWTGLADQLRPDLLDAQIGNGEHAFYVDIAREALVAGPLQVRAIIRETGQDLEESPTILKVHTDRFAAVDGVLQESDQAFDATALRNDALRFEWSEEQTPLETTTSPRAFKFGGSLDAITEYQVSGWAINRDRPDLPVSVDFLHGTSLLCRVTANAYRHDLEAAGLGRGYCAFSFPTPSALLDGHPHTVRLFVTNTDIELLSSPRLITLPAAVSAQILGQLRSMTRDAIERIRQVDHLLNDGVIDHVAQQQSALSVYQLWNARYATINSADRAAMFACMIELAKRPLISIVLPTYNTPRKLLNDAIQSVIEQIYPNWELCIADDASSSLTKDALNAFAAEDSRIRVQFREVNGHISEATNTALNMVRGEYICFMDHDDLLTPDALLQIAREIIRSNPDIIYSDEDKIDARSIAVEPHFKPDFNYSLLLSYNYICHVLVIRSSVVRRVGYFDTDYNGAQDHDYLLRCCEIVDPKKIAHIPLVLYHWRAHSDSTATNIETKDYAVDAGMRAIRRHLARTKKSGRVSLGKGNSYRVTWDVPNPAPKVSIIIPTRDSAAILSVCLLGLITETSYKNIEILIIDNGSKEQETLDLFSEMTPFPFVRIIRHEAPFNYSRICNLGAREATGDLLLMLNNDIEVLDPDWLTEMVGQISQTNVGAVGAKLLYPDGRIQHAGVILGIGGVAGHAHKYLNQADYGYMNRLNVVQDLMACTAACLLLRKDVFDAVGGFNEEDLGVAFNDVDLCLKIGTAGYRVVYTPYATLRHHESISRGAENTPAKLFRARKEVSYMLATWQQLLACDPHYSRNLTLEHEDFRIDPSRGASRLEPYELVDGR